MGRRPKNSERGGYIVNHNHNHNHQHQHHSDHQMPTKMETSEIRAVNLRRSSTSLDMVDVKHTNELHGVVLTLGGPGNVNGNGTTSFID